MFGVTPLSPAYGRDYKSAKEVKEDFLAGKDFQTPAGQYINIRAFDALDLQTVEIRYARLTKAVIMELPK